MNRCRRSFILACLAALAPACGGGGGGGGGGVAPAAPTPAPTIAADALPGTAFPALSPVVLVSPVQVDITAMSDLQATNAIQAALTTGGTIQVITGGARTVVVTSTLSIPDHNVVILDGGGTLTLSGGNSLRILQKGWQAQLTVQNLNFINAKAPTSGASFVDLSGAAINCAIWDGRLTVINCTFTNCIAPAIDPDAGGGAIHSFGQRHTQISGCTFTGCQGSNGGTLKSQGSELTIINCSFASSHALGSGGTGGAGGAIAIDGMDQNADLPQLVIENCQFTNCIADRFGGAVEITTYTTSVATLIVDNTTFSGNSISTGNAQAGALYAFNGTLSVSHSTFNNNSAPGQGGAVWVQTGDGVLIENCTLDHNTAGTFAGALTVSSGLFTLTNCTISDNSSGLWGAGIFWFGGMSNNVASTGTVLNCLFQNNVGAAPAGDGSTSNVTFPSGSANLQWPQLKVTSQPDLLVTSTAAFSSVTLSALAQNSGTTFTRSIPTGSAAQNAGVSAGAPNHDQRGLPRQGAVDIGSFERQPSDPP